MKLVYHGQHGPEVTVGNAGEGAQWVLAAGEPGDVPDDVGHRLIREQPGVFSTQAHPQVSAAKDEWAGFRAGQGHVVEGLTKQELIDLPDDPAELVEEEV